MAFESSHQSGTTWRHTALSAAAVLIIAGALLTVLPPWHFILEWNGTAAPLYIPLLGGVVVGAVFLRRIAIRRRLVCGGSAFLLMLRLVALHAEFAPGWTPPQRETGALEPAVSIVTLSVRSAAEVPAALKLLEPRPDIVAVRGEFAADAARALMSAAAPGAGVVVGRGAALVSRFPLAEEPRASLGDDAAPALAAQLSLDGGRHALVAVFALPPLHDHASMVRNRRAMRRAAVLARHAADLVIVAGDLAARRTSHTFGLFIDGADLYDAAWGQGGSIRGDRSPWHRIFARDHILLKGARVSAIEALPWGGTGPAPVRVMIGDGARHSPQL